jgi:D-alanyl-D-alanine carboxypeptidase (penicillin-binding protein 5/6)
MKVRYQKNQNVAQQPASTTKLMTAILLIESGVDLDDTVTVTSADVVNWAQESNAQLVNGDVISYRDLLFGMILPSGNDAANCIARNVGGGMPGGGSGTSKFVSAMNTKAASLGMSTANFVTPSGMGDAQRMSANDLALLMGAFSQNSYLVEVAGTMTHAITITGTNARTYNVSHTIDPDGTVKFPEFICGKTGIYTSGSNPANDSGACLVMLWEKSPGVRMISAVMGAATGLDLYKDMRRLINFELAR